MLSFFPSLDPQNPPERIDEIAKTLAGTPFEPVVVEGAKHGFAQPASPGFHPTEGPKAWRRCIEFFKEHLH
jgi:dienelactone hydrolase